jgi:hypothetical protein
VFSMKNLFTEDFGYLPEMLRSSWLFCNIVLSN